MANRQQAGQSGWAKRWASLVAGGVLAMATGCSNTAMVNGQTHDPMLGVMVPPGAPPPTDAHKATSSTFPGAQQGESPASVAALPTSFSATNNATLAATSWQGPLGRPLALDDNKSSGPPFLPGQATQVSRTQPIQGFIPPNPNPKVEQVPDDKPANPFGAPGSTWQPAPIDPNVVKTSNTAPAAGNEAVFKQLQERGVLLQKQDTVPEGLKLTCYLSRGPAGGFRILEVVAADYPSAAQAILQQLDAGR